MDRHARIKERERAHLAKQIIENPLWLEARETLTANLLDAWRSTAVAQEHEREKIWLMLNAAEAVFGHIETVIQTGQLAERQMEVEDGRSST